MVFDVKASNKMSFYSDSLRVREIHKDSTWTVEELAKAVPEQLLFDRREAQK